MQAGTLFFIVGASGVGKDTLVAEAMRLLQGTHRYMQVRRAITRPAGNGEDHEPVGDAEFDARLSKGAFLHSWAAHGLHCRSSMTCARAIDVTAKGASVRAAVNIVGSGMLGQDQLGLS